jgi:uncharacterized DUF497 family protein
MPFYFFHWDDDLVEYIAQHGVSVDDFQTVVMSSWRTIQSKTTDRDIVFGWTGDGRYIACVFEWIDKDSILPITAFEVEY